MTFKQMIVRLIAGLGIFFWGSYWEQAKNNIGDFGYFIIGTLVWIAFYLLIEISTVFK